MIVCGDFFQLPPVIGTDEEIEILSKYYGRAVDEKSAYAFLGRYWFSMYFHCIVLTEVMRQDNQDFIRALNQVRIGNVAGISFFNSHCVASALDNAPTLYPFNDQVDVINHNELEKITGEEYLVEAMVDGDVTTKQRDIPSKIRLKIHCRVIITSNSYNRDRSGKQNRLYHNGTVGTVQDIYVNKDNPMEDWVIVKTDEGNRIRLYRKEYQIPRYVIDEKTDTYRKEIRGIIWQIPLRLAYAYTVHKGQGATFDAVNVFPSYMKSAGQLYVALSRAKNLDKLRLLCQIKEQDVMVNPVVTELYEHLTDTDYTYSWAGLNTYVDEQKKKKQTTPRLTRYECKTKSMRIPDEMASVLRNSLQKIYSKSGVDENKEQALIDFIVNVSTHSVVRKKSISTNHSGGRPSVYPNGTTVIQIPETLVAKIKNLLNILYTSEGVAEEAVKEVNAFLSNICDQ